MDSLIKTLESFNIHKNEQQFNIELDSVIDSFENLNKCDEWITLKLNYSKIRYLNELIDNFYIPNSEKFLKSLDLFMINLDKITNYYLHEISWKSQDPDIQEDAIQIEEFLILSLNSTDCITKIKLVLKAYNILVPIVLEINDERFADIIDDETFLKEFSVKKRKL